MTINSREFKNTVKSVKDGVAPRKDAAKPERQRKPDWLRVQLPAGDVYKQVKENVTGNRMATVCEEAKCPNLAECWSAGTATLMLMGSVCTRGCKFCAVATGNPAGLLDPDEPRLAAESVKAMGLGYVVLTSVDRDDLPDGGAGHYAACVKAIKTASPDTAVEALTPDFQGNTDDVNIVLASGISVYAQNVETVRRLTHPVRDPRASYDQTLSVLAHAKKARPDILTKTSLMLGLGETDDEIFETMDDLRAIGVDIVTFGQYLQPTSAHLPIERWVPPEDFKRYRDEGLAKGFLEVVSGPLVRSSYRAERALEKNNAGIAL